MIAIEKIITSLEENICLLVKHGKITDVALISLYSFFPSLDYHINIFNFVSHRIY